MKEWKTEEIKTNILISERWLERAIIALYNCQEPSEQAEGDTFSKNGVGFNMIDAPFMSSLAEWINSGKKLSVKQVQAARRIIPKYIGQLTRIANGGQK